MKRSLQGTSSILFALSMAFILLGALTAGHTAMADSPPNPQNQSSCIFCRDNKCDQSNAYQCSRNTYCLENQKQDYGCSCQASLDDYGFPTCTCQIIP